MKRILVTGCGRSGTQYLTRVLQNLRLRVTHEQVYRQDLSLDSFSIQAMEGRWRERETKIEVSWLAAPFVGRQPKDVIIWHQLRDPLKVVRCWTSHGYLNPERIQQVQPVPVVGEYIQQFLPQCACSSDLTRAVQYVLGWNRLIAKGMEDRLQACRYRIEELHASQLQDLLLEAGHQVKLSRIEAALTEVQPGIGGCNPNQHRELTWKQIRDVAGGVALQELAELYGYVTEPVD